MSDNLIIRTDSYKVTHWKQYPPNAEYVYSYYESRGGTPSKTVFFGLQYYLKKYLAGEVVTDDMIEDAQMFFEKHFGRDVFNIDGWQRIVDEHGGRLPVVIKALPEGSLVDVSTPLMTVENIDPELPWLTNYIETILCEIWYPITVSTRSHYMKQTIMKYLEDTGTPEDVGFKLHDFGFRGSTSVESASIGGAAHLVNFFGTDTMVALEMLAEYYDCDMAGVSIPASEHSTITSWGRENEVDAFDNMITQFPDGIIACVSDSFNIYEACDALWGRKLRDKVMSRDGTLVVRPDSGYPEKVVLQCLEILGDRFGYTTNEKGYKVLDPHVRMIQGDGIDHDMITSILEVMKMKGWSADNIAFGSGGALLQKMNRDTYNFAFKCSEITINGEQYPVYKNPITQHDKASKSGRFDGLTEVFRNGKVMVEYTLEDIRARLDRGGLN
jgi:nicotinamide phosphoribosyltransferase